jgi:flagellar hook assembly protein FlgD
MAVLSDGIQESGKHTIGWDGTGQDGSLISDGIYFCRISFDGWTRTITLVFAR